MVERLNLTKEQKIKLIEYCINVYSKKTIYFFICNALIDGLFVLFKIDLGLNVEEDFLENTFPEIWKYKPSTRHGRSSWFTVGAKGFIKRIEVLENSLKDLK